MEVIFKEKNNFKFIINELITLIMLLILIDLIREIVLFKFQETLYVNLIFLVITMLFLFRLILVILKWIKDPFAFIKITDSQFIIKELFTSKVLSLKTSNIKFFYCVFESKNKVVLRIGYNLEPDKTKFKDVLILKWNNYREILLKLKEYAEKNNIKFYFLDGEITDELNNIEDYRIDMNTFFNRLEENITLEKIIKLDYLNKIWKKIGFVIFIYASFILRFYSEKALHNKKETINLILMVTLGLILYNIFHIYYRKKGYSRHNIMMSILPAFLGTIMFIGIVVLDICKYVKPEIFNKVLTKLFG